MLKEGSRGASGVSPQLWQPVALPRKPRHTQSVGSSISEGDTSACCVISLQPQGAQH